MSKITCNLCPRHCSIPEGERGFCYARGESNGKIIFKDYGKLSALCLDPIEKKPLYHFFPGIDILSIGTVGCNLSCQFCQNCHLSRDRTGIPLSIKATPEELIAMLKHQHCRAIAFTYNEPLISYEYVIDVAKLAREENIKTVAVTAGYVEAQYRTNFFKLMDATNIDLKAFSQEFYQRNCGVSLASILDTLRYVHEQTSCWLEVTTLLIPEENDSNQELEQMSEWFVRNLGPDVPWHFSAFFPRYKMLNKNPTPLSTLKRAKEIAQSKGINYIYLGNVHTDKDENTYCPYCKNELIVREGYMVIENIISNNTCPKCKNKIPGVFYDL